MFKNFYADAYFNRITEISPDYLKDRGIEGVILDIDNTLIGHDVPIPDEKVLSHLRLLEENGLKLCVVSNNDYDRVSAFSEKIGIKYFVHKALKPRLHGYMLAGEEMQLPMQSIAAIGDQIFTDVWGAKRAGCFSILTKPLHKGGEGFFIALKRILETPFVAGRF